MDPQSYGLPAANQPRVVSNVEIWMEARSEDGRSYYYSIDTRATSWKRPTEIPGRLVVKDLAKPPTLPLQQETTSQVSPQQVMPQVEQVPVAMSMPPPAVVNRFTPLQTSGVAGLPPVRSAKQSCWANQPTPVASNVEIWMEARSEDGRSYYYSIDTRATSWQRPTEIPGRLVVKDLANPPTLPLQTPKQEEPSGDAAHPTQAPTTTYNQKCRPVEYKTIEGSQWCVVWTNDGQVFFYNPAVKTSVWERPPELRKRTDVDQLVRTVPKKVQKSRKRLNAKQKAAHSEENSGEMPSEPKHLKVRTEVDEERQRKEQEMRAELRAYREQREREREERERRRLIELEEERQARERRRRERQEREERRERRRREHHAEEEPCIKEEEDPSR